MPDPKAHEISLAVWDVPSPVRVSGSFSVKAGARCSEGCPLNGQEIFIRFTSGTTVGRSKLGAEPWPGTTALYWADVHLVAPDVAGTHVYDATFVPAHLESSHGPAASRFSFIAAPPAEHVIDVKIFDKTTGTSIGDVEVRFGMYRCHVGDSGEGRVQLPKGCYDIVVYKLGYQALPRPIEVSGDAVVEIAVEPEPEPENYWG